MACTNFDSHAVYSEKTQQAQTAKATADGIRLSLGMNEDFRITRNFGIVSSGTRLKQVRLPRPILKRKTQKNRKNYISNDIKFYLHNKSIKRHYCKIQHIDPLTFLSSLYPVG